MRRSSLSATTLVAIVAFATGCGGDDEPDDASTTTTAEATADTSPLFTEDTISSSGEASTPATDPAGSTTIAAGDSTAAPTTAPGATETPTTLADDGTTPTAPGTSPTTTAGQPTSATTTVAGDTSPVTTINNTGITTDDFIVGTGIANVDGEDEATTEVRVRSGATGDVVLPVTSLLTIVIPGPTEWDLDVDPDDRIVEFVDVDDIEDGEDGDPFPEDGGAVIITLRPLTVATTTVRVISFDGPGDPITINIIAV